MKKLLYITFLGVLMLAFAGCQEDERLPEGASTGAPRPVTNATVENVPGGAKITYTLPDNRDLLYVKAVFVRNGEEAEVKSSLYNNYLVVSGFGDMKSHEVKLYAVNRFEEISSAVSVTITPLEPPVVSIFKSIKTNADFSGLNFSYENDAEAEVSIHVLTKNAAGELVAAQDVSGSPSIIYTKRKNGLAAVRGFLPVEREFSIYVKDRFNNNSDTLDVKLTPFAEIELDRNCSDCFKAVTGATSDVPPVGGWGIDKMFNNTFNDPTYHTNTFSGMPQWATFSVGPSAVISRFKMWQRFGAEYLAANPRRFELWGTNTFTNDYTGWVLLGTFESIRPSGLQVGAASTAEDLAYIRAGEEFVLPPGSPAVKYLRIKTTETWGRVAYVHINELRFWGNPQ